MYKYGAYTVNGIDVNAEISQVPDHTPYSEEGEMKPSLSLATVTQDAIVWLAASTLYSVIVLISLSTLPPAENLERKLKYVPLRRTTSISLDKRCVLRTVLKLCLRSIMTMVPLRMHV